MMALAWVVGFLTVGLLFLSIFAIFSCKHAWEFVDKTEFPPPIQEFTRNGGKSLTLAYLDELQVERMSRKTVVIVLRCPKCGAAQILRESH